MTTTNSELTARIDSLRADVAAMLDNPASKLTPKQKAVLKEISQLLSEAADEAEEAGL